jgi:arylsulfatase A-like enzyme
MVNRRRRAARADAAVVVTLSGIGAGCGGEGGTGDVARRPEVVPATLGASNDPPNIVFITTDDQTVDHLRVMSRTREWLEEGGLRFDRMIASYPLCCPARATWLTGQYAQNHGVLWNTPPDGGFATFAGDQDRTLVTALQAAGYRTSFVGKYLNGFGQDPEQLVTPPGWDSFIANVSPTQSLYYDYTLLENGQLVDYGSDPDDYITDVLTEQALAQLDAGLGSGQPLFLWVSYTAPHNNGGRSFEDPTPLRIQQDVFNERDSVPVAAPRHQAAFATETLPDPPSFAEADVDDKPRDIRTPPITTEERTALVTNYQAELATLLAVDEGVDRLMQALDEAGALDDTYVVFTSDNGYQHGEHGLVEGKYFPYEESLVVPLLVRGPGVRVGEVEDAVVADIDLVPTLVELAAADPPRPVDGQSLAGALAAPDTLGRRAILLEGYAPADVDSAYVGVHTGTTVYVEYETGGVELYDLTTDPFQLENLAGLPEHRRLEATMRRYLHELRGCAGTACRVVPADARDGGG